MAQVNTGRPIATAIAPERDPAYLKYIVTFQEENPMGPWGICARCGSAHNLEAAHTGPVPGRGVKPSDYSCIPLCALCHRTSDDSYHNRVIPESLWMKLGGIDDLSAVIEKLLEGWR